MQTIILGGGCFWCTESVFRHVKGVSDVTSGYMGGEANTANYRAVCEGDSGHIEVIKVDFDEAMIDLDTLLAIFFATHDPTTQDRQGNDVGRQYASVVFYVDDSQKVVIEQTISELKANGSKIVTEVYPAVTFYPAEDYHQDYFAKNPTQGYCSFVIPPKLAKLKQYFGGFMVVS
ncbi:MULTISPECIES: peptide-methionine (S)-S-oxide reductase MsrA [unclassified Moraxella]|uniref:peptide-methionine (S)-S-oxide reductase MsrA n=1 Tax=unclassified Moraxella TaxID=2685852 RepID=UPI003AF6F956